MIKIEASMDEDYFSLIDDEKEGEDRYIKRLSSNEVKTLGMTIIRLIK